MKKQTFEQFLESELFAPNYSGTDDDMSDKFDAWLEQLDIQKLIDYADLYGRSQYLSGQEAILLK